jgi:hypothetical protein
MSPGGWIIGAGGVSSGLPPTHQSGDGAQMNAIRGLRQFTNDRSFQIECIA